MTTKAVLIKIKIKITLSRSLNLQPSSSNRLSITWRIWRLLSISTRGDDQSMIIYIHIRRRYAIIINVIEFKYHGNFLLMILFRAAFNMFGSVVFVDWWDRLIIKLPSDSILWFRSPPILFPASIHSFWDIQKLLNMGRSAAILAPTKGVELWFAFPSA